MFATTDTTSLFNYLVYATASSTNAGIPIYGLYGSTSSASNGSAGVWLSTTSTANSNNYGAYGIYNGWTSSTATSGTNSLNAYGTYTTATKSGADTSSGTFNLYGEYVTASNTGSTNNGTKNTYGGYFSATGSASGTAATYGVYTTASGGDSNIAAWLDGTVVVDLGTSSDEAICGEDGDADVTDVTLRDCSGSPVSDYAEIYPTADNVEFRDVVTTGTEIITYKGLDQFGNISDDPSNTEQTVEAVKSSMPYDNKVIGVVSNNYTDFASTGHNRINDSDHPLPIALSGRVKVKVTDEGGPINVGDELTTSSTPGTAMKADPRLGSTFGKALTGFTGPGTGEVLAFIEINTRYNLLDAFQNMLTPASEVALGQNPSLLNKNLLDTGGTLKEEYKNKILTAEQVQKLVKEELAATSSATLSTQSSQNQNDILQNLSTNPNPIDSNLTQNSGLEVYKEADNLVVELSENNTVQIKNKDKETKISFDSFGNATFTGTVTADKIVAGKIEGLEILTDKISSLSSSVQNLAGQVAGQSTASAGLEVSPSPQASPQPEINVDKIFVSTATVNLDLKVLGNLQANGALTVNGPAEFRGDTIFRQLAQFIDKVIFKGDVAFEGAPTFNKDTAGSALVKKDSNYVDITFEKEYPQTPVVNISIALDKISDQNAQQNLEDAILSGDIRYIVTNRTVQGFTIKLNKSAPADIQFSWTALSVKDPKTFSNGPSLSPSASLPTTQPTGSPQTSPSLSPGQSPSASP